MCGILCVLSKRIPSDRLLIHRSGKTLTGRGPDCCCRVSLQGSIYDFYRLCIVDKSPLGNQPFVSGDIVVLCNGEIYNHVQLEEEYELKCESKSDCEVILRLYEKLKDFTKVVRLLDGVFAIVLTDGNKCWFARDRIGVRPMFKGWTQKGGHLALASLAKTLLPFCKDVKPVKPGIIYRFTKGRKVCSESYSLIRGDMATLRGIREPYEDAIIMLHDRLVNAVKKRLMADRPIGCLLSGGLDSSIITAILCKLIGPGNVRTYSVGMKGGLDLKYARKVADSLGTDHTEVIVEVEDAIAAIPQVIYDTETYDITTIRASTMMWLLCNWISNNSSDIVIFSGEGSDELFCGYLYFHNAPNEYEASKESYRLIKQLYLYDVLRADRSVSCHGLELRVPFLDIEVLHFALSVPAEYKAVMSDGWEKKILREAFGSYLPAEVAWRRKDGMSDGTSSLEKSWSMCIQEFVDTRIGDEIFDSSKYMSKEAMYYKLLFDKFFPTYKLKIDMWMPKWSGDLKDPSGRLIQAFDETPQDTETDPEDVGK